ncbi:hypothetical protein GQ53DRAFT_878878 [Thozetella sp. PMI_491]|nr:hypothetical protein GQ53DRAFT_878878 [Thozetella sp. PMI_491]
MPAIFSKAHTAFLVRKVATTVALYLSVFVLLVTLASIQDRPTLIFLGAFFLRYVRVFVHFFYFWAYRPAPEPVRPVYSERDVTVILPTVDPHKYLVRCLDSVAANKPSKIIVVTAGRKLKSEVKEVVRTKNLASTTGVIVTAASQPNKRQQVAHAIKKVKTEFIVSADDSVVWPSAKLLRSILNAFEESTRVGLVGTNKRVLRDVHGTLWAQFWNFIGCSYLARHNFEIRATNAANGGTFVVSGRTLGIRTSVAQDPEFLEGYTTETFLSQPLLPDDDNYIHRYMVTHRWDVKIQYTSDARVETSLGTYPRFLSQCLRWARTTFRSNPILLADNITWSRYPWTTPAALVTGMINFALIVDPLLVYLLLQTKLYQEAERPWVICLALVIWILMTKTIKLIPHFLLHPTDVFFFPGYVAFAYFHSVLKFYAMLTLWDVSWSGRKLDELMEEERGLNIDSDDEK